MTRAAAQVLRNICYKVVEQDQQSGTDDWKDIVSLIQRLFLIEVKKPIFNQTRGSLMMSYKQRGVEGELDISLAGRGLQQILLILGYLYWHKNSILMVDEPDAHLEILRQKQVYEILKHVAEKNSCQVIIATHSEVILDDAVDTNLTLLLHGEAVNLAKLQDMKHALRSFGIEHYYNAKVHPRILYVEGSSDIEMLQALSAKLDHVEAATVLSGKLNCYYICNTEPEDTLENKIDRAGGAYGRYEAHFYTLKHFVPGLQGIAIFDGDGKPRPDTETEGLAVCYWQHYELENYFITPDLLLKYAAAQFNEEGELFSYSYTEEFRKVVDQCLLNRVFAGDHQQLSEFHNASPGLKRTLLRSVKMSEFAETVFGQFAREQKQPVLLNKGEFYRLVELVEPSDIPSEVIDKLNLLVKYLNIDDAAGNLSET